MEMKAVEDMTREEITAERARLVAVRAELNGEKIQDISLSALDPEMLTKVNDRDDDDDDDEAPATWAYLTMQYGGMHLEVRKPDESALVALSMAGTPGLTPQTQMRIFTKFVMNHLSSESFITVVEAMTDPESDVDIQGLITKLTKLRG